MSPLTFELRDHIVVACSCELPPATDQAWLLMWTSTGCKPSMVAYVDLGGLPPSNSLYMHVRGVWCVVCG